MGVILVLYYFTTKSLVGKHTRSPSVVVHCNEIPRFSKEANFINLNISGDRRPDAEPGTTEESENH